jgi:hypothetical protein
MDKFMPREKLSKREKKALDRKSRVTWGFNPATRRTKNKKAYMREKPHLRDFAPDAVFLHTLSGCHAVIPPCFCTRKMIRYMRKGETAMGRIIAEAGNGRGTI